MDHFVRRIALLAALALMGAHAPVIAGITPAVNGPPHGSPMQIESCIIHPPSAPAVATTAVGTALLVRATKSQFLQDVEIGGGLLAGVSESQPYLSIRMTNESAQPIVLVRIRVRSADGSVGYVRDAGTFSPGIEIHHIYVRGAGTTGTSWWSSATGLSCSVDFLVYKNGGVWHAHR